MSNDHKKRKQHKDSADAQIRALTTSYIDLAHPSAFYDLNDEQQVAYYAILATKQPTAWTTTSLQSAINLAVLDVAINDLNRDLAMGNADLIVENQNTGTNRAGPIVAVLTALNSSRNSILGKLGLNQNDRNQLLNASEETVGKVINQMTLTPTKPSTINFAAQAEKLRNRGK